MSKNAQRFQKTHGPKQKHVEARKEEAQERAKSLVAKNENQKQYIKALQTKTLVAASGAAGTGKTFVAAAHAALLLLEGKIDKIVLTRAYVTMGKSVGLFPGGIREKLEPFLKPMMNTIKEYLGDGKFECDLNSGKIQIFPLEAIRGMSFENAIIILDEAQNTTPDEMKSITTRIGENCQLICCGDTKQKDVKGKSGLEFIEEIIYTNDLYEAAVIHFTSDDIVRSGLVRELVKIYDALGDKINE